MGLWLLMLALQGVGGQDQELVVSTSAGFVRGERKLSSLDKEVDVWASIPFAEPPVGDLRFMAPQPKRSWSGERDVRKPANSCSQPRTGAFNFSGESIWLPNTPVSEDCLYLQVARPVLPAFQRRDPLPVMVWIYGGSFYSGSYTLDLYDPRLLASEQKVVVVGLNYRVASLGFLYLGEEGVGGNAGLLDQVMALRWIKENIHSFGGDPNAITLFSESAGSVSVAFHLLSPLSRNLFTRAILQSATAFNPWALLTRQESRRRSLKLARLIGCPTGARDGAREALSCLRGAKPEELLDAEWKEEEGYGPISQGVLAMPFVPIVDGEFLPTDPLRMMETGNFKQTSLLLGACREEANYFLIYYDPSLWPHNREDVVMTKKQFDRAVQEVNGPVKPVGQAAIKFMYTDWMNPSSTNSNMVALDRMVGDYAFTCPVVNFAHHYARASPPNDVYLYHYTHHTVNSPWPRWSGVMHGDEIAFIFGDPFKKKPEALIDYTDEERMLSRTMMAFWANFAKTGNPNLSGKGAHSSVGGTYWPLHSATNKEFLRIKTANHTQGKGLRAKECAFWGDYLPHLLKKAEDPPEPPPCKCHCPAPPPVASCDCPGTSIAPGPPHSSLLPTLMALLTSALLFCLVL